MSDPSPEPPLAAATPPPFAALLAVAIAVAVVHQVPLFGVDREVLAGMMGPWAVKVPIYLSPLALASLFASPRTDSSGGRAAFVFAVLGSGWIAFTQLHWLATPTWGMQDLVVWPGRGLQVLVALTAAAAHAILLWLATRLEGPRVHGLWWVVAAAWIVQWLPSAGEAWWALSVEEVASAFVYGAGLLPALAATTLWAGLAPEHPRIRSFADALGLALLPAAILGDGLRFAGVGMALPGGWWTLIAVALVLPAVAVGALAIQHRTRPTPLRAVAVGLPGLLAVGFFLLGGLDREVVERLTDPGPFAGEVDATLVLGADDPGPSDVDVLQARLDALGIQGTLTPQAPGRAQLVLEDVVSVPVVLDAILPRRAFSLRAVVEDGHVEPVDVTLQDCSTDPCRPMALGVPRLDARDIDEAYLAYDDYGRAHVRLVFTAKGGQVFGDWTTEMVRKRIAIVLDDEVVSAPVVMEPITGGEASIDMGTETADALADARALAAALSHDPLQGHWVPR